MAEFPPLERYVAIDCEMVSGYQGSKLAKVGIVDHRGEILMNTFVYVNPKNVRDYLTDKTGVRPRDVTGAPTFEVIQKRVKELLKDKIVVGHAAFNDLAAIQHRHPYELIRDTSLYIPLRERVGVMREGEYPSLKKLSKEVLGREIQGGQHDPVEDARAAMDLYLSVREVYEAAWREGREGEVVSGMPPSYAQWYW